MCELASCKATAASPCALRMKPITALPGIAPQRSHRLYLLPRDRARLGPIDPFGEQAH